MTILQAILTFLMYTSPVWILGFFEIRSQRRFNRYLAKKEQDRSDDFKKYANDMFEGFKQCLDRHKTKAQEGMKRSDFYFSSTTPHSVYDDYLGYMSLLDSRPTFDDQYLVEYKRGIEAEMMRYFEDFIKEYIPLWSQEASKIYQVRSYRIEEYIRTLADTIENSEPDIQYAKSFRGEFNNIATLVSWLHDNIIQYTNFQGKRIAITVVKPDITAPNEPFLKHAVIRTVEDHQAFLKLKLEELGTRVERYCNKVRNISSNPN